MAQPSGCRGVPSGSYDATGSSDGDDAANHSTVTTVDGVTCRSMAAQDAKGLAITYCVRGFWRRAVIV